MKILFINYEFPPLGGGGGTTSKYLAEALAALGQEIKILTAGFRDLPSKARVDGYEINRVNCRRRRQSQCTQREMFSFVLNAIKPMLRIIDNWKPDIIHIFFSLPTGPLGWVAKKFRGTPYLVYLLGGDVPGFLAHEMNWEHKLLKEVSRQIWKNSSGVVANSRGLADLGNIAFPDICIEVITNGINLNAFRPSRKNSSLQTLNLLFVGRLVPQKGLLTLLKSIDIIVNQRAQKNIKLKIVGDGREREQAEKYIKGKNLNDYIEFLGWVKLEGLNKIYNSADVFMLPSTFEGMASVVLQAMACGLPTISTKVLGSEDLVENGKNGFLVEVGDFQAMAEKISYLSNNREIILEMGKESLKIVSGYDWKIIAKKFLNNYETIYHGKK